MKTIPLTVTAVAALLSLPFVASFAAKDEEMKPRQAESDTPPAAERPPEEKPHPREQAEDRRTWLGVATTPVAPSLHRHLELADGFGVQIREVLEDSPAQKAGLRPTDVLVKFDDQRLTTPEHLSLLVRERAEGEKAPLTLIRKGKTETVSVTLGETDAATLTRRGFPPRGPADAPPRPPAFDHDDPRKWQESMKRYQDQWRDWMERREKKPTDRPPRRADGPRERVPHERKRDDEGRPPAVSVTPGFPVTVFGSEGVIKIDNQEGEVTITRREGEHHIEIRSADGDLIHEGEYDPERGTKGLPAAAREQLEVMKLDNLEVLVPRAGDPEKTSGPQESGEEKSEKDQDEDDIL